MFELQILSPQGESYSDTVDEVTLPTDRGEITVLTNHIPLYTKLTEGIILIKKGSKDTQIAITQGFLEIQDNKITILSDYAVPAESIQVAKALEAKKRAEELIQKKASAIDVLIAEKELQKSIMELKIAEKIKRR